MRIITSPTFLAGLVVSYVAAGPVSVPDISSPNDIVVRHYLGPEFESQIPHIEKRDEPYFIDLSNNLADAPLVRACRDINLAGPCVKIKSRPGQCGKPCFFPFIFDKNDVLHEAL